MKILNTLVVIALLSVGLWAFVGPFQDIVHNLPLPGVDYTWYSGYLPIGKGESFHYILFPSQHDPDSDPVLLWLNGGPGCSSLIGMTYENGPFKFLPNNTNKVANPWSWNKQANLLYIESPGSVGFSIGFSNHSDESVQEDNLFALQTFFAKYPTLRSNPFYISGESYAGIYVPWLALAIHKYNQQATALPINLKGIMVGNACTDPMQCYTVGPNGTSLYQYEFLYRHGFYTDVQYSRMRAACVLAYNSRNCQIIRDQLDDLFSKTRTPILNIYEVCYGAPSGYKKTKVRQSGRLQGDLDCDDQLGALTWLNDPIVRLELHIPASVPAWSPCNDDLYQKYQMNQTASYWIYPILMSNGYRVWVYSGDVDADVPLTGTKVWMQRLREDFNVPIMEPWREWWVQGKHSYDDQVGGMLWQLQNLTLVTVKKAGHMVPKDQPEASYAMVSAFLEGRVLPDKLPNPKVE